MPKDPLTWLSEQQNAPKDPLVWLNEQAPKVSEQAPKVGDSFDPLGEFGKGIIRSGRQIVSNLYSSLDVFRKAAEKSPFLRTSDTIPSGESIEMKKSDVPSDFEIKAKEQMEKAPMAQVPSIKNIRTDNFSNTAKDFGNYVAGTLGQVLPQIAASVGGYLTGGKLGALGVSLVQNVGDVEQELKESGVDNPAIALGIGTVVASLDALSAINIGSRILDVDPVKLKGKLIRGIVSGFHKGGKSELKTEVPQEIFQVVGVAMASGDSKKLSEILPRAIDAAVGGYLGGGLAEGTATAVSGIGDSERGIQESKEGMEKRDKAWREALKPRQEQTSEQTQQQAEKTNEQTQQQVPSEQTQQQTPPEQTQEQAPTQPEFEEQSISEEPSEVSKPKRPKKPVELTEALEKLSGLPPTPENIKKLFPRRVTVDEAFRLSMEIEKIGRDEAEVRIDNVIDSEPKKEDTFKVPLEDIAPLQKQTKLSESKLERFRKSGSPEDLEAVVVRIDKNGKLSLLDGRHRLAVAVEKGFPYLRVRFVDERVRVKSRVGEAPTEDVVKQNEEVTQEVPQEAPQKQQRGKKLYYPVGTILEVDGKIQIVVDSSKVRPIVSDITHMVKPEGERKKVALKLKANPSLIAEASGRFNEEQLNELEMRTEDEVMREKIEQYRENPSESRYWDIVNDYQLDVLKPILKMGRLSPYEGGLAGQLPLVPVDTPVVEMGEEVGTDDSKKEPKVSSGKRKRKAVVEAESEQKGSGETVEASRVLQDKKKSVRLKAVSKKLETKANEAIERVKKRGTLSGGKLSAGVPVDDLADMAAWGAYRLSKGVVDFSMWSTEMAARFGEGIREYLRDIYQRSREIYNDAVREVKRAEVDLEWGMNLGEAMDLFPEIPTRNLRRLYDNWVDWRNDIGKKSVREVWPDLPLSGRIEDKLDVLPAKAIDDLRFTSWLFRLRNNQDVNIRHTAFDDETLRMFSPIGEELLRLETPQEVSERIRADLDKVNRIGKYMETILQFVYRNPHIPEIKRYVDVVRDHFSQKRNYWMMRANDTADSWNRLGKKKGRILSDILFEATIRSDRLGRQLMEREIAEIGSRLGADRDVMEVFDMIQRDFRDFIVEMEEAIIGNIRRTGGADLVKIHVSDVKEKFEGLKSRTYFPLPRFGNYATIVRDKTTGKMVYYSQYEVASLGASKSELWKKMLRRIGAMDIQDVDYDRIRRRFPEDRFSITKTKIPESARAFLVLPPQVWSAIKNRLDLSPEQEKVIDDLVMSMAPGMSWVKHMKRRSGIAGFSTQAKRAYKQYFLSGSNHLARVAHGWELREALGDLRKSADSRIGDTRKRMELLEVFSDHYNDLMNPRNDYTLLHGWAWFYYFMFTPKQIAMNFTQIPMLLYPHLTSTIGKPFGISDMVVAKEIAKAAWKVWNMYGGKSTFLLGSVAGGAIGSLGGPAVAGAGAALGGAAALKIGEHFLPNKHVTRLDIANKILSDDELTALLKARSLGFLDESYATNLAGIVYGSVLHRMVPGVDILDTTARTLTETGTLPFHLSEQTMRYMSFLAAYNLARNGGLDRDTAFDYARQTIELTMGEYQKWNRPKAFRGIAAPVFIFRTFLQFNVFYALYGPGRMRMWLTMLALGGLWGLPFAEDAKHLLETAMTWLKKITGSEKPFVDLDESARLFLLDMGLRPDVFLNGISSKSFMIPTIANMVGLTFPEFDISASLQMGRIVPGLGPVADALRQSAGAGGLSFDDASKTILDVLGEIAGVGGGMTLSATRAALQTAVDDKQRLAGMMYPMFLKNISRSIQAQTTGMLTTSQGKELIKFDMNDPEHRIEVIGMSLGFPSSRLRNMQVKDFLTYEKARFYLAWRTTLLHNFEIASGSGDIEAIAEARNAIHQFNKSAPRGLQIGGDTLRGSIGDRVRNKRLRERGLPSVKSLIDIYRDIDKAFPQSQAATNVSPE